MTEGEVLDIFKECGAWLTGHFELASGLHSAEYLEKFRILEHPNHVETLCREIAERVRHKNADVVMGPTTGGVILAYEVAKNLGTRAVYAEKGDGGRVLRRGMKVNLGERVIIVDDIYTTGGSVKDCLKLVEEAGAEAVAVGLLGERSGGKYDLGVEMFPLLRVEIENYDPAECPLCKQGIPLQTPGGKHLKGVA
jgi:orotate phosphoribosyltransferase